MGGRLKTLRAVIAAAAVALAGGLVPDASAAPAWEALGAGVDGPVYALAVDDGRVYAGGAFTSAGGAPAQHVAVWDGAAWAQLGAGTQHDSDGVGAGAVHALAADGGSVYVGGNFTHVGDPAVAVGHVARWDGTALLPTPVVSYDTIGLIGAVYAVEPAPGGGVYVGGAFTSLAAWWETGAYGKVVKFDGSAWSPLAVAFPAAEDVMGMAVAADGRIAVGTYDGGDGTGHAWILSGGSWTELGPGFDNIVEAVAFGPDGALYAGGDFTFLDENPDTTLVRGIAKWNPTLATWQPVGGGADGRVHAIVFDPAGRMLIGGDFRYINDDLSTDYGRIAMWDGAAWSRVGGGVGQWIDGGDRQIVEAIVIDPTGRLTAGGSFTGAGEGALLPASNIAAITAAAPAAPSGVSATAGDGRATVTWDPLEGAASVTYTATASGGGGTCSPVAPATSTCTVTGLRNGTAYTVTVTAANEAATGPASAPSAPVTPRAPVPPAPTIGATTLVGNALVTVVTMRSAGTVVQQAKRRSGKRWIRFCRISATAAAAKVVTMRCPLGRATLSALRKHAIRVSSAVTATPTGGSSLTAGTQLTIPKRRR